MSQARAQFSATPLFGGLTKKVLPLPEYSMERSPCLNFGRNATESCNQLAAFFPVSPSHFPSPHHLSLSLHLQPFVGAPFGPLAVARRCRFAIFGHLPRPAWDQSCHSCSHSLSHSFTHSLPHSFTTFSLLCGLCHVISCNNNHSKDNIKS